MTTSVDLFSMKKGEILKFLKKYYDENYKIKEDLHWKKIFENPIEMVDLIGSFIDNNEKFEITMWICLDEDVLINVNSTNANNIIKYLFERYPY